MYKKKPKQAKPPGAAALLLIPPATAAAADIWNWGGAPAPEGGRRRCPLSLSLLWDPLFLLRPRLYRV